MTNNSKRTIDLSLISGASILHSDVIINTQEYDDLFAHITNILNKIPDFEKSLQSKSSKVAHYRVHDVITVHGKRGTGKTSFLLSSLALLKGEKKVDNPIFSDVPNDVCVLEIMDPTLFACREHLLHALLSQIKKKIVEHENHKNVLDFSDDCQVEQWYSSLQHLAVGLKAVGETREDLGHESGTRMHWEDPEYLMQYDMEAIQHSMELEQAFHKIINRALGILGKKAFVLALDDTDTRPAIGWHVLEVLRRYFTTPQLVVIISGDLDLFAAIIRQKHADSLRLNSSHHSTPEETLKKIITGLTEQYLLKILRSNLRIRLGNFQVSVLEQGGRDITQSLELIMIKKEQGQGEHSLQKLLDTFFNDIGCYHGVEKRLFTRALLNNPIRTVVQVIDALYDRKVHDIAEKLDWAKKRFAFRLCEIFFTQIRDFGFSPFKLQEELMTAHGITHLMGELIPNEHVALGMGLLPHYEKSDENEALVCIYVNFLQAIKREPFVALLYLFKVCLLREILNKKTNSFTKVDFEYLKNYLCLDMEEPLYKTVKRMTGLLWKTPDIPNRTVKYGTVRLYKESYVNSYRYDYAIDTTRKPWSTDFKTQELYDELFTRYCHGDVSLFGDRCIHTLSSLRSRVTSWHKNFIFSGAVSIDNDDDRYNFFSALSIIAFMGDLLMCKDKKDVILLIKKSKGRDGITAFNLQQAAHERSRTTEHASYEDSEVILPRFQSDNIDAISELLFAWIEQVRRIPKMNLFPTLCAKSMERFFNAIQSIKSEFLGTRFLGSYLHRCIVIFLNSILVEEFYLSENVYKEDIHVTLQDPINKDFVFVANLINSKLFTYKKTEKSSEDEDKSHFTHVSNQYPIFYFIFSCPLWGLYLNQKEKVDLKYEEESVSVFDLYSLAIERLHKKSLKVAFNAKCFYEINLYNEDIASEDTDGKNNYIILSNLYPALNLVGISTKNYLMYNDFLSRNTYYFICEEIKNSEHFEKLSKHVRSRRRYDKGFKNLVKPILLENFASELLHKAIDGSNSFYEDLFSFIKDTIATDQDHA